MTEPFVRPDVRVFLDMLKLSPRPTMTPEALPAMRLMAPQGMAMLEPPVGELAVARDATAPGPAGEIALRMFDARASREAGAPPTLLVTAALDPLRDQGRAYAAKAVAAGVQTTYREIPGVIHGFLGFRRAIPSAQQDFVTLLETAKSMIGESLAAPPG